MDTNLPWSQVGETTALEPITNQHWLNTSEGIGSLFVPWVGPMPQLARSDPYEHRNVSTFTLPENYKGQNLYVRDTIEYNVITARQSYIYKELLPVYQTDQVNLQWENFEANAHLLDLTPYMTLSHLVTQKRQICRAQLKRHGIQAEFERDFLGTPMGRQSFLAAVNQIVNSVAESFTQEGTRALCTGHRRQAQYLRDCGMNPEQVQRHFLEEDRKRFAIVQKSKNGLEKLHVMIKKEMDRTGGIANAYVIPEEVAHYAQLVPEEKTDYYLAGQEGPNRVNGVPGRTAAGGTNGVNTRIEPLYLIRETPTFIANNLNVEGASEAETQQFSRYRQIGEYVTMLDTTTNYNGYTSEWRSIEMYSQEIDDMVRIDLEHAINASEVWDANDNVASPGDWKSSGARKEDLDEDFLIFLVKDQNGVVRRFPVQHIFDMAPEHLSAKKVLGGGQTLQAAMNRSNPGVDKAMRELIAARTAGAAYAAADADVKTAAETVAEAYFGIATKGSAITAGTNAEAIYNWIVGAGKAPAKRPALKVTDVQSVGQKFIQAHIAATPAVKRAEVEQIMRNEDIPILERSEQVKERFHEYLSSNVQGVAFKAPANIEAWHAERVKQYHEKIAEVSAMGDIVFVAPGRSDVEYVHESSVIPNSSALERMTPLRAAIDAQRTARQGGYRRAQYGESGNAMGLSSIGTMMEPRGELLTMGGTTAAKTDGKFDITDRYATLDAHLKNLSGSEVSKIFAILFLCINVNKNNMLMLCEHNVVVPMNFLLLRPHMQYRTRAIVKCMRGGGTGFIFAGNSNLMMGWESDRKMARMHYTIHYRAVIVYPKNLYYQPDVFVQEIDGDVGGAGCRFYTAESYRNRDQDNLVDSLICCAIPITETVFPEFLSITGRLPFQENAKLSYSTAERYRLKFGFGNQAGRIAGEIPSHGSAKTHDNLICCQGHQQNFVPGENCHSKIIVCKGHWGKNVYAGCKAVRNGNLEMLEKQHYKTNAH